ncbi:hypothetical protein WH47_10778 [Habropoda laboriosa]|uniref:Uncharacterized protein n=1 Tax=Habropoda laboriosa TaxID=597456 RepID=A0A0L7RDB3_9HYME|nr:hypothetical protein WH47_10778 [Habropoda laboriosa]
MDEFPKNCHAFHPKDPPYGTLNYDIGALNKYQKIRLNLRRTTERNENELYLKLHPEIKGLISVLLRYVLLHRQPSTDPRETIGEFFDRPRREIVVDLLEYFLHGEEAFESENVLLRI